MKKIHSIFYWGVPLLLLLAACGEDAAPTIRSGDTAEVRVASNLGADTAGTAEALSVQGVPVDPETGESGVAKAVLEVYDTPTGEQLFFRGGQIVSEAEGEAVTFTPEEGGVALALPPGNYSFFLSAFDDREPANELAFGLSENVEVGDAPVQVSIFLGSFLGDVTLRVPESVQPNAIFDAFLEVSPPGRPDLRVPEGDYAVVYEASEPSQILSESQLGARVAAGCDDVRIVARTRRVGPRAKARFETNATVPVSGEACGDGSGVGADLIPPFVAITSPSEGANVDADFTLVGDVNDQQSGVDRVEVYEGTVLLGEADIDTDEMRWSFDVSLEKGAYTLTAVAFDNAGNTSREEVRVTVEEGDGSTGGETCTDPVEIPDENLKERLNQALERPDDAELTCENLAELTELELQNLDGLEADNVVTRLEGLQYAINLERLELFTRTFRSYDPYEDLEVISSLKELTYFETDQSVQDLSFLAGAVSLETLVLTSRFTQGSPNEYTDLAPLANLTNLRVLDLGSVPKGALVDITPLADLTALENLDLSNNSVSDLTPLVANEGLGQGDTVNVAGNPLEACPGSEDRRNIDALLRRGVEVVFSEPTDCQPDGGEQACTDPLEIPDENLRNIIRGALDLSDDAELTCEALAELTELFIGYTDGPDAESFNVSNLEGLQYAVNLERLELRLNTFRGSSPIDDLSPLAGLENLTYLKVDKESLEDISFVAELTALEELDLTPLQSGRIEDISPLANLVNLERLYLSRNSFIRDISPLANLTELDILFLDGNAVRDITPLEDLTDLDVLVLDVNEIADLSPLLENEGLGEGDDEISLSSNCFDPADPNVLAVVRQLEARNPNQMNVTYDEFSSPSESDCSYLE